MIVMQSRLRADLAMSREDAFFRYFPVNEETMSWGIYVTGAGRSVVPPGEKYPPSGHPTLYHFDWLRGRTLPEFQLMLITGGAGEFESEATGQVRIEHSGAILIFPGVWHRYRPHPTVGWTERWFSFNGEMLQRMFDIGLFGPSGSRFKRCGLFQTSSRSGLKMPWSRAQCRSAAVPRTEMIRSCSGRWKSFGPTARARCRSATSPGSCR
jgi:hypothetical protein